MISAAQTLADSIRRIFSDDSVSEIFAGENQLFWAQAAGSSGCQQPPMLAAASDPADAPGRRLLERLPSSRD